MCQDLRDFKLVLNKDKDEKNVARETVTATKRVHMLDSIAEIMSKIKAKIGRDRINFREKFYDFDKLRKYVCHKQKAQSLLKIHMPELTEKEIDTILEE